MRGSTAGLSVSLKGESKAHYALLSILDSAFAIFILAPSVVCYWRGVWELMAIYVYPEEPAISAAISTTIGFSGHLIAALGQYDFEQTLDPNKKRLTYIFGSRLYTTVFGFACVNTWRGVWLLLDHFTETGLNTVLATTLVSAVALAFMRCLRNISAPPFSIITDAVKGYFEVPTMFRVPRSQKNTPVYVLDCLFSVFVIGTLVVFVWRGAWVLLDMFLFPDDEGSSAIGSIVLGYIITLMAFLLQPLMRWICANTSGICRVGIADTYLLFSFVGTVNVWRGIWNTLNLYYLPDEPEISCWSTHIIFLVLLILLKCSNSVLVRGVYIDAEEPAGKCVVFPCYYLRLYFQNQRAKKNNIQLQSLVSTRRKSEGDFAKIKPMDSQYCTCHMTEAVANHITVNIPLVTPIKECSDSESKDVIL